MTGGIIFLYTVAFLYRGEVFGKPSVLPGNGAKVDIEIDGKTISTQMLSVHKNIYTSQNVLIVSTFIKINIAYIFSRVRKQDRRSNNNKQN